MHSCSISIGRLPCPCNGFQDGANTGVCDTCSHSLSQHLPSTALPPMRGPSTIGPTPGRSQVVVSLFQSLLKTTPDGALAVQETSNGIRRSGTGTVVGCSKIGSRIGSDFRNRVPHIDKDYPYLAQVPRPRPSPAPSSGFIRSSSLHVALRQTSR